ncbi:DUF5988 family protein [Amycolatopsis methanolica]|uniref:DUF5988 family protein n=1 Tax=Amycolatopsis methanolica TaxID=1814 RepID=UPI0034317DE6
MNSRPRTAFVEVELVNEHDEVTTLSVDDASLRQGTLKIQVGNGYDHFVLARREVRDGRTVPVYSWIQRTRIAE